MFLQKQSLETELYREYDFGGRTYKIENPKELYFRQGGSTHRVVDSNNIVHCIPAPGVNGCVLRWLNRDTTVPVNF